MTAQVTSDLPELAVQGISNEASVLPLLDKPERPQVGGDSRGAAAARQCVQRIVLFGRGRSLRLSIPHLALGEDAAFGGGVQSEARSSPSRLPGLRHHCAPDIISERTATNAFWLLC